MPGLVYYKGLQVLSPAPSGPGGLAIQNNFQAVADRIGTAGVPAAFDLARFGTAPDLLSINNGVIGLAGGVRRRLDFRPELNTDEINKAGVPTSIHIGMFFGYSMPIWNNDEEELHYMQHVPHRWDGVSDITVYMVCCLASAETMGETFRYQLSWNRITASNVVPITTIDVEAETIVLGAAQYMVYEVEFTIDWDAITPNLQASDLLGVRLRRVASSGDEVDGEIIVLDVHESYIVDKMFGAL